MAKVKAKVSFAGIITMGVGEVRDVSDDEIVKDLVSAGYVEKVKTPAKKKEEKNEN